MIRIDLIKRKISLIQAELARLKEFAGLSFDEIAKDFVKQAAVERFLERVVNRAVDINNHLINELAKRDTKTPVRYRETFLVLADMGVYSQDFAEQIAKSAGTRNMLVHEYDEIDPEQVYHSIDDCLRDYTQYCQSILDFIAKNESGS